MLIILYFFVWMLIFTFPFILMRHFFIFQVQNLFVIKLGCSLTSRNMFVVCRIHIFLFFALHFILCTHFLHEEKRVK
jgi:hypothetical protein